MALCSAALLKKQTPLQQLLEDINFQRTKEMRQLLKDDSGFVVVQGTTYWTDLFVRHFLFQNEPVQTIDSDDLLFFVRKKHVKSSSRHMPKFETEVEVFRKDSRKLPIGDPDVDWEETVYLNMVIHQFDYTLTLAICTRTSPKELQVLKRHSQRVYASPSRRKMDSKGENEEITYPHICFMVDNFDEVFSDILVRDGEMVCVELVANDKDGACQGVIFLGSIRYDALKKVYDARQSSLSSKVAQRMTFGLFNSGANVQTRCEFVRMKGPQGKGHAEMAVTKPKGSGVETPTSEPGFCATDMWDDWEDETDDYCTYRHQRRLSDPSANLNNFNRYSWRTKNSTGDASSGGAGAKARSENEGLDSLANDLSEIEAGDLRDDLCPAFSASVTILHDTCNRPTISNNNKQTNIPDTNTTSSSASSSSSTTASATATATATASAKQTNLKLPHQDSSPTDEQSQVNDVNLSSPRPEKPAAQGEALELKPIVSSSNSRSNSPKNYSKAKTNTSCTNCFGGVGGSKKSRKWIKSDLGKNAEQMSDIYCRSCDHAANATPACLETLTSPINKSSNSRKTSVLTFESELVVPRKGRISLIDRQSLSVGKRSASLSAADAKQQQPQPQQQQQKGKTESFLRKGKLKMKENEKPLEKEKDKDKAKEKSKPKEPKSAEKPGKSQRTAANLLAKVSPKRIRSKFSDTSPKSSKSGSKTKAEKTAPQPVCKEESKAEKLEEDCEIADDAISLNGHMMEDNERSSHLNSKAGILVEHETQTLIYVRGKEELPVINGNDQHYPNDLSVDDAKKEESHEPSLIPDRSSVAFKLDKEHQDQEDSMNPEGFLLLNENGEEAKLLQNAKRLTSASQQSFFQKAMKHVPKHRTADGTVIYYWCDLPKRVLKELDDGAYNPLWASRGFTQSFHFWKENRRQQSTPLNAFLTYVTLPWWSIAKDLLDHRETPILTF